MIYFRTPCISGHLNSFCKRLNELADGGIRFVYTMMPGKMRQTIGWSLEADYPNEKDSPVARTEAEKADVLLDMLRELDIFEKRCHAGLPTYYWGERWFKPISIGVGARCRCSLPGWVRMLVPSYWKMAKRFGKLMDDPNFYVLPIGVHAARDLIKIYHVIHGKISYLWRTPKNTIERKLGGAVEDFPRMKLWAYFVAPRTEQRVINEKCKVISEGTLKVLWAGRMIGCKRVDVLVKAVRRVVESGKRKIELTLIGEGPERARLEKLAKGADFITFSPYVKNDELRKLMRAADLYVMPSNGEEGWGAAVSEALAEGCDVISTREAGSSATLLEDEYLYSSNSVDELAEKLIVFKPSGKRFDAKSWSGERAADLVRKWL